MPDPTRGAARTADGTWTFPEDIPRHRPKGENQVGEGRFTGRIDLKNGNPRTRTGTVAEAIVRFVDRFLTCTFPGTFPGTFPVVDESVAGDRPGRGVRT